MISGWCSVNNRVSPTGTIDPFRVARSLPSATADPHSPSLRLTNLNLKRLIVADVPAVADADHGGPGPAGANADHGLVLLPTADALLLATATANQTNATNATVDSAV